MVRRSLIRLADVDAVISRMEEKFEMILRANSNPSTKAAYLEIVQLFDKEEKATSLREMVYNVCVKDLRDGANSVGWQLYLKQATTIVLTTAAGREDIDHILEMLLQNDNEDVVLKALQWMNASHTKYPLVTRILHDLVSQVKWDGVCSLALWAMSSM